MFPILQIGPLAVQTPGLFLLIGLWIGLNLAERQAPRHGIPGAQLYNLVFAALAAGLVGGRLGYAAQVPRAFLSAPLGLISPNPQLFDGPSGLLAAILVAGIYAARRKLPFWQTLDALTPMLAVLGVAAGLAHAASGSAFGAPADLPWSIELWGARRHPSQFYETGAAIAIAMLIWRISPRLAAPGLLFLSFLAGSAAARLFLEAFRGDSLLLPGGLRTAQLAAWLILAAALYLISRQRRASLAQPEPSV